MEETQHLSKYARKQQRLAEEKNFGTDYTKQIEQAEREQQEQQQSDTPKNAQKLDTDALIAELERRGYIVKEEGEDNNE